MTDRLLRDVARPAILALMVGIFGVALQRLATLFAPAWEGGYVPWLLAVVVLETYLSHRYIQSAELRGVGYIRFRLAEVLVLFGVVRLAPYVAGAQAWRELGAWIAAPHLLFASIEAWALFAASILVWQSIKPTFREFDVIDGPQAAEFALPAYSYNHWRQEVLAYKGDLRDYNVAYHALFSRFLQGGIFLLLLTAFASVEVNSILTTARPTVRGGLFGGVGFYFLSGLVILGMIRLVGLRRRWQAEYMQVDSTVAHNWLIYLALLLGVAGGVAALLPTGYTLPLLIGAGGVIQFIISVLAFLVLGLMFVIAFPFVWLLWFVSSLLGGNNPAPALTPPIPPPPPASLSPELGLFAIVQAIFLWSLVGLGLWYLARVYFGGRAFTPPPLPATLNRGWQWLLGLWVTWRERWRQRPRRPRVIPAAPSPSAPAIVRPRAHKLSGPRGAMVELYLRFLRRTQQEGHPRRAAETPEEYTERFAATLPDLQPDSTLLTEAFMQARYAPHPIEPETVETAQSAWERVRQALRRQVKP